MSVTNTDIQKINTAVDALTQSVQVNQQLLSFVNARSFQQHTYSRPSLPTSAKTSVTIPAGMVVVINGTAYATEKAYVLQASQAGDANARAGKDCYIYACEPANGTEPVFVLSMNATVPAGYNAANSRKIGGFHCLCANVGTIANHAASGYVKGDIIPQSMWDLLHRAASENNGMVFVEELNLWVDIYLASWNGSKLTSVYGAMIVDGVSAKPMHGELLVEEGGKAKKRLLCRDEFMILADSANQMTNISGSSNPLTSGGHKDTAGRRMITKDFVEDTCGALWQWTRDIVKVQQSASDILNPSSQTDDEEGHHYAGSSWQNDGRGTANIEIDGATNVKGQSLGAFLRVLVGGDWDDGSHCGSRSVDLADCSSRRDPRFAGRFGSSPRVVHL